ncbi:MAG: hypothetical protein LC790_12030 [Actinobacteria bacterium]|nr:hypothetical protein [Actinomycetota bacterium]MCA1699576.1 hypothetical protein [Actinomycetota bacterium]
MVDLVDHPPDSTSRPTNLLTYDYIGDARPRDADAQANSAEASEMTFGRQRILLLVRSSDG